MDVLEKVKVSPKLTKPEVRRPPMYEVVMLNDDFTPMEFVVRVLRTVFRLDETSATKTMMQVHHEGRGICGRFPRDIAETKIAQVIEMARSQGYPLFCQAQGI